MNIAAARPAVEGDAAGDAPTFRNDGTKGTSSGMLPAVPGMDAAISVISEGNGRANGRANGRSGAAQPRA